MMLFKKQITFIFIIFLSILFFFFPSILFAHTETFLKPINNDVIEGGNCCFHNGSKGCDKDVICGYEIRNYMFCRVYSDAEHHGFLSICEDGYRSDVIKTFLEKGDITDIDKLDSDDKTILMHASSECRVDIVGIILKKGANVNIVNSIGNTALMYSCEATCFSVTRILLANGAGVNYENNKKETAILLVYKPSSDRSIVLEIIKLLIEKKQISITKMNLGIHCLSMRLDMVLLS